MIEQSLLLVTLKFVFVVVYSEQMPGVVHNLSQAEFNSCSCLGDTLMFECTVMRGTETIWTGSAFNCTNTNNEVYFLESDYNRTSDNTIVTCNDGMITGQVVGVEDNYYTSRLNVTLTSDLIGKTIECVYGDGVRNFTIMDTIMNLEEYPPPKKLTISLVDLGSKQITFSWSPVAPDCPTIHYNILASNCGRCPTTTNHATVTCIDVPTDSSISRSMCSFGVQTVFCENIIGDVSERLEFDVTETFNETVNSNKVDTSSISIFIVGVSALLITIVIVILACYWLRKRSPATKTSSRFSETNSDSDSSPQQSDHAISQQEDKDTYEYSQLTETPVNLKRLLEKLQGQTSKQWYQFGLTLGLPMDVLEGFNLYSEDDCLAEVLDYWLKHHLGKPTWQEITDAQKKIETFNIEQDTVTGAADKKAATASDIPPPKPPRRTSSVTMKKSVVSPTETATGDPGHEYEVIY